MPGGCSLGIWDVRHFHEPRADSAVFSVTRAGLCGHTPQAGFLTDVDGCDPCSQRRGHCKAPLLMGQQSQSSVHS